MSSSSPPVGGGKTALQHVAQYVRPLLGEAGERLVQNVEKSNREAVMKGFVGLAFVETDRRCVLFAQTINQDMMKQTQNWSTVYRYSRTVPFVTAVTESFPSQAVFSRRYYSLSGLDFHRKGIHAPLTEAFKTGSATSATFALLRRKISGEVVLYCALPKKLHGSRKIVEIFQMGFDLAKSFFLLNLLNAFFLAQATLPDDRELANLLRILKDRLGLQPGFFDRFLETQGAALADLHAPSTWLTSPYNLTTLPEPTLQPSDAESWMRGIRGASSITLLRPLFGSFQGKAVNLVTLKPRTHGGHAAGAPYPAVVKKASLDSVVKEHRGYIKVQEYFDEIRDVMPPLSVAWKLSERKGSDKYAVVTSRVSGDTLRAFIRDRWGSPWALAGQRVKTLGCLLEKLLRFTEVIGRAAESTEARKPVHQPLLDSHLGKSAEAKRREKKTCEALAFFLDSYRKTERLKFGETTVANPLWVFDRRRSIRWVGRNNCELMRSSCRHGDFHAGNILVTEQAGVTVLDFDYVDKGYRFDDEATLEASFLLSVANADKFKDSNNWKQVFPALLKSLAAQADNVTPETSVLQDPDAFEIWTLVQTIRREVMQRRYFHIYRSLLGTALFRLITSCRLELVDPRQYHPGVFSTALLYLGLILDNLVNKKMWKQTTAPVIDLFPHSEQESTNPLMCDSKLDLSRAYLQAVFKWQAGLAKPKPRQGAEGFAIELKEHLEELGTFVRNKLPVSERASVYRFGLRLKREAQSNDSSTSLIEVGRWAQLLARIYSDKAARSHDKSKQAFQKWATRYEQADARNVEGERRQIRDARVYQDVAPVQKSIVGWNTCGLSDRGDYHGTRKNDDAFAIMKIGKMLVAAVADGTGDSLDGGRAATLALSVMRKQLELGTGLAAAIFQASEEVQADNCAQRLDGACCLVAVRAKASGDVELANVGDTRFIPVGADQGAFPANVNKAKRRVLGGEPIGDIITSGGNLVRELRSADEVGLRHYEAVQRFALVSDGAFVSDDDTDIREIKAILRKSTNAKEAAEAIKQRALDAFDSEKKPDNVTVVVGWLG